MKVGMKKVVLIAIIISYGIIHLMGVYHVTRRLNRIEMYQEAYGKWIEEHEWRLYKMSQ